jgi:hypothetical protein
MSIQLHTGNEMQATEETILLKATSQHAPHQAAELLIVVLGGSVKKLLILTTIFMAFVTIGAAQTHSSAPASHPSAPAYHSSAPAYHAPAQHTTPRSTTPRSTTPRQTTPRQNQQHQFHTSNPKSNNAQRNAERDKRNADRNQRNADRIAAKAHSKAVKQENKARHQRNKQLHSANKAARAAFSNGRFNGRFYAGHFGPYHRFGFCGPGRFWIGSPYASPFWFGGVEFDFDSGVLWPGAWGRCDGLYIGYFDDVGYALVDPAYGDVTLPLAVDIDAQPMDEPDEQ